MHAKRFGDLHHHQHSDCSNYSNEEEGGGLTKVGYTPKVIP